VHRVSGDAALRNLFAGNTLSGRYPDGTHWTEYFAADGSSLYRETGKPCPGDWKVLAGFPCFTYLHHRYGDCFEVWRTKDTLLLVPPSHDRNGDDVIVVDRIAAGDVENLANIRNTSCSGAEASRLRDQSKAIPGQ